MTLQLASINWAIDYIVQHSDGDLFPKILEIDAVVARKDEFSKAVANKNLTTFPPGVCRRFIVPKDEVSYRQATQLAPQDSIILSAIIFEYGSGIELRRLPPDQVFSYRFSNTNTDGLYKSHSAWNAFWEKAAQKASNSGCILHCDIADFYNQIYHHTLENQLAESHLPNQANKWVVKLLESTTAGVSRGVPVGPHGIHLVAESTLIPIDNNLVQIGIDFIRYADDIIVFAQDQKSARLALAKVAAILDQHQRLMLQKHKTKFYTPSDFQELCSSMIQDRPINEQEEDLLEIVKRYSDGDPYKTITYNQISTEDWNSISNEIVSNIILEYLSKDPVDYIRLRWFYRRLAQIGHPGGLEVTLDNIQHLGPCFANICFYLSSIQSIDNTKWTDVGTKLLQLLDTEEVQNSEYFRLSILSLFARNAQLNHFDQLLNMYQSGDPFVRREIILSASSAGATDWLRNLKESFGMMDSWQRNAFIFAISGLPRDEKKYFINRHDYKQVFDDELAKWSRSI